jgi:membrane-bound serine protease (ClpP class)
VRVNACRALLLISLASCGQPERAPRAADAPSAPVAALIDVDGPITPMVARHLELELERAAVARGHAVLVRLDTQGGLDRSIRDMTEAIAASPVPVVVHVAPAGARAGSAGLPLVLAAHVAAMAPGAHLGAPQPAGDRASEVGRDRVTEDAAALARTLARTRGRNMELAARAVRGGVALGAEQAVRERVVDLIAPDVDALLARVDGRAVETAAGTVRLRTAGAVVERRRMRLADRLLSVVAGPNIAYLLFTLGLLGILAEMFIARLRWAGAVAPFALLLALAAFGSLPVNWIGLGLLVLGFGLLAAAVHSGRVGALAAPGGLAFGLGSVLLYRAQGPIGSVGRVSPWMIGLAGLLVASAVYLALRQSLPGTAAAERRLDELIGRVAIATSRLDPAGTVSVGGESWSARCDEGAIAERGRVVIIGARGATLRVARVPAGYQREPD